MVEKASIEKKRVDEVLRLCVKADDAELEPKLKTGCPAAKADAVKAQKTLTDAAHLEKDKDSLSKVAWKKNIWDTLVERFTACKKVNMWITICAKMGAMANTAK